MNWEKFWNKVERRGPNDCWHWRGKVRDAYGTANVEGVAEHSCHRLALTFILGRPIRDGMWALHSCDVKSCTNPRHVYEGTPSRNALDRWDRSTPRIGKRWFGQTNSRMAMRSLAEALFVSDPLIRRIASRDDSLRSLIQWRPLSDRSARPSHDCPGHEQRIATYVARAEELRVSLYGSGKRQQESLADCTLWNATLPIAVVNTNRHVAA